MTTREQIGALRELAERAKRAKEALARGDAGAFWQANAVADYEYAVQHPETILGVFAALDALTAEHEASARDAERWRVVRQCLSVDGDYADGGEGWSPHVQFLICDEAKLTAISEVGHAWTVEQLVDHHAARAATREEER